MKYRITTPLLGFTGVSAGVNFTNGAAEIEAPELPPLPEGRDPDRQERQERDRIGQDDGFRQLRYFRTQGYGVEEVSEPEPADEPLTPVPVDPLTPVVVSKAPARSAPKSDWFAYAIANGMDEDEADKLTRDQLVELFLDKKGAAS
jgi:hypothetical protein